MPASEAVQQVMGSRTAPNTEKSSASSMKRFANFVLCNLPVNDTIKDYENWLRFKTKIGINDHPTVRDNTTSEIDLVKEMLFNDDSGGIIPKLYSDWTTEQLKNIRYYLCEFSVNYRKER